MDERIFRVPQVCIYCGGEVVTREHCPSRALLDKPYSENIPTVPSCKLCNEGFSLDEEYLACFIDCVISGSTNPTKVQREKVSKILERKPTMAKRIEASKQEDEKGNLTWTPESKRIEEIILKLARGHVAVELSAVVPEEPDDLYFMPLIAMSKEWYEEFERAGAGEIAPWPGELGSRAFLRAAGQIPFGIQDGPWVIIQEGRYRYSLHEGGSVQVSMVLSEYLACQVYWEEYGQIDFN